MSANLWRVLSDLKHAYLFNFIEFLKLYTAADYLIAGLLIAYLQIGLLLEFLVCLTFVLCSV